MLKIRLKRVGRRNLPFYRLVVTEASASTRGKFIETLGHFNPRLRSESLVINEDRVKYWMTHGAKPSPTAHNLLVDKSILSVPKLKATRAQKKPKT